MKLTNSYVILAKDTTIDNTDGTLSIYKVIDKFDLNVPKADFEKFFLNGPLDQPLNSPANFSIASQWIADDKVAKDTAFTLKFDLLSPSERVLSSIIQEVVMPKGHDIFRFTVNVQGLPVVGSGRYLIRAHAQNTQHHTLDTGEAFLDVVISPVES